MGEWGRGNLHILTEIQKTLQKFTCLKVYSFKGVYITGIYIFFEKSDYNNRFPVNLIKKIIKKRINKNCKTSYKYPCF